MTTASQPLGLFIYAAVKPIFKIYFIIIMGFILAKRSILTVSTCRDISNMIVTAIMPCLIFNNVVLNLKSSDIKNLGIIFFTGTILFAVGFLFAVVVYFLTLAPKRWRYGLLLVGLFPNISDLPIAYLQTLAKGELVFSTAELNKGVAYVCIFLAAQIMYQFSFGMYRLMELDFRIAEDTEAEATKGKDKGNVKSSAPSSSTFDKLASDSDAEKNTSPLNRHSISPSTSLHASQSYPASSLESVGSPESFYASQSNAHITSSNELNRRDSRMSIASEQEPYQSSSREPQQMHDIIRAYSHVNDETEPEDGSVCSSSRSLQLTRLERTKYLLKQFLINLLSPNSFSLILSIAICMAPPLKALFVSNGLMHLPNAPDEQPPLLFIIDLASYVGGALVPLGLLLLGATIARLEVKIMPPGFWKTAIAITLVRLVLLPIFGVGLTTGLYKAGWYDGDDMLRFVLVLDFGLPSATALVYFTAFYTDPEAETHLQMDCLAVCLIGQYLILWFTLPFLVTFTFKVSLGY